MHITTIIDNAVHYYLRFESGAPRWTRRPRAAAALNQPQIDAITRMLRAAAPQFDYQQDPPRIDPKNP